MRFQTGGAALALWFLVPGAADDGVVHTHKWPGKLDVAYYSMAGDLMNVTASEWALADWCCFEKAKTENGDEACCVSEKDDTYENMYIDDKERLRCPHAGVSKNKDEWDRRRRLRVAPAAAPQPARAARELGHCCACALILRARARPPPALPPHFSRERHTRSPSISLTALGAALAGDPGQYCKCMERMLVDGDLETEGRECELPCEYRKGKRNPQLYRTFFWIAIISGVVALCCLKNSGRIEDDDQELWRLVVSMNGFMACSHFSGFASALIGGALLAAFNGEYPTACKLILHNFGTMFLMLGCVIEFSIFALATMIGVMTLQKRADDRKAEKERIETAKRLLREKAEQPGSVCVWIKMLSGETIPLQVEPDDKYELLAERVHLKTGIAPEMQRLIFQNKDLASCCKTSTLDEQGVKDGMNVQLLIVHADNEHNALARVHPIMEPEEKQEVKLNAEQLDRLEDARALPDAFPRS